MSFLCDTLSVNSRCFAVQRAFCHAFSTLQNWCWDSGHNCDIPYMNEYFHLSRSYDPDGCGSQERGKGVHLMQNRQRVLPLQVSL
jgi:hypothetical protein